MTGIVSCITVSNKVPVTLDSSLTANSTKYERSGCKKCPVSYMNVCMSQDHAVARKVHYR
jgi:hypothetical protein